MSFLKSPLGLLVVGLLLILLYAQIRKGGFDLDLDGARPGIDHPQITKTPVVATAVAQTGENVN